MRGKNVKKMNKYCVVCGEEFGPVFKRCCTQNSIVAKIICGFFRKKTKYYSLDGRELSQEEIAQIRKAETKKHLEEKNKVEVFGKRAMEHSIEALAKSQKIDTPNKSETFGEKVYPPLFSDDLQNIINSMGSRIKVEDIHYVKTNTLEMTEISNLAKKVFMKEKENPYAHYAYALALKWGMQMANAEEEMKNLSEKHPNFFEAEMFIEKNMLWRDGYHFLEWNEESKKFPSLYYKTLLKTGILNFRDGLNRIACLCSRAERKWFSQIPFPPHVKGSLEITMVNTPITPVIAFCSTINDNPKIPVIGEFTLLASKKDDYDTFRLFCNQKYTYLIITDEYYNLLMNRKIVYNSELQNKLFNMEKKLKGIPKKEKLEQHEILSAVNEYQKKFSLDNIKFTDYNLKNSPYFYESKISGVGQRKEKEETVNNKMGLTGIQIFKYLPKTNCGDCKFPTCLAFAMRLAAAQVRLDACPHVSEEAKKVI